MTFNYAWEYAELNPSLRWIHHKLAQVEFAQLLRDAQLRLGRCSPSTQKLLQPLVERDRGKLVAASYFKILSGSVATLGGVRATPGWEKSAIDMLTWQVSALRETGVAQIQAILHADDLASETLVRQTGWKRLTYVEHQWLSVQQACDNIQIDDSQIRFQPALEEQLTGEAASAGETDLQWRWRPACDFAHSRLAQFLEATFHQTLDCPAMNGQRDRREVLQGFLDGRPLRQTESMWQVLEIAGSVAGCLLLQQHAPELIELVYMGLLPEARGQGLGRALVHRAISTARQLQCQSLVVAVDEQNWPAMNVYRQFGFQRHQRLQVWLAESFPMNEATVSL